MTTTLQAGRRWWRPWRMLLGLVVAAFVLRLGWGWFVARQLQAQLDALRARGEPVDVGDLACPEVPDAENAWLLQAQAAASLAPNAPPPRDSDLETVGYPPFSAEWMKLATACEQANGQVFALARQARQLPAVSLQVRLTSPMFMVLLPHCRPARELASVLADGALYAHLRGDDAEALDRVLDLLHLAQSMRQGQSILEQLVATGMEAMAYEAVQMIAAGMTFQAPATTRPATDAQIQALIDQFLNEDRSRDGMQRGLQADRVIAIDSSRFLSRGLWFVRPLTDRDMIRLNRNLDLVLDAARCATWPEAQEVLDRCMWEPGQGMMGRRKQVPRYSRWFDVLGGGHDRYVNIHFRIIAERRAIAIALAWRLYVARHGRWPQRLEELVPAFLPALPADPYHADGRAIGYTIIKGGLPDGGDRPMLYFDAGPDLPVPAAPCYGWMTDERPGRRSDPPRQYRDLVRFTPAPSAEAVDHDPEEPDAAGENAQQGDQAE